MLASAIWHQETIEVLLKKEGVDINEESNDGLTALMIAAQEENNEMVKTLLGMNIDVNKKNDAGFTALMLAVKR